MADFGGIYNPRPRELARIGGIIERGRPQVLHRLDQSTLAAALRRLPIDELRPALQTKLVPLVNLADLQYFAACGPHALCLAKEHGLTVVAQASPADFLAAARQAQGRWLLAEATSGLARRLPMMSASRRLTDRQGAMLAAGVGLVILGVLHLPLAASWFLASLAAALFFLSVIAVRLLCLLPPPVPPPPPAPRLADTDLPHYSVLVPLHRETSVLRQLLEALDRIDYPRDRLDLKLIIEESDIPMQRELAALQLPGHVDVIVVPCGSPQTKPRALNYALHFARGSLLTIFDAEDIPEPGQLRRAAEAFAMLPSDTVCLQAELVFDNPGENWLTRQFAVEYATLFGMILPALDRHRLPLPLGGTSNHFRSEILRAVGAWDAYNVTEDADLGIRLARMGYDTATIAVRTFEEATMHPGNWLRQRARWMKGFLATWLVHMREPVETFRELGPAGFWSMQAMTIGVFASALVHPPCLIATLLLAVLHPGVPEGANAAMMSLAGLNLLVFVLGYAVTMMAGWRAVRHRSPGGWLLPMVTMPLYWLFMSLAAWLALWQFLVAPFHWNKTRHGQSRQRRMTQKFR